MESAKVKLRNNVPQTSSAVTRWIHYTKGLLSLDGDGEVDDSFLTKYADRRLLVLNEHSCAYFIFFGYDHAQRSAWIKLPGSDHFLGIILLRKLMVLFRTTGISLTCSSTGIWDLGSGIWGLRTTQFLRARRLERGVHVGTLMTAHVCTFAVANTTLLRNS